MRLDPENIHISELHTGNHWNMDRLNLIFGNHMSNHFIHNGPVTVSGYNNWVWYLDTKAKKTTFIVYSHLNSIAACEQSWKG